MARFQGDRANLSVTQVDSRDPARRGRTFSYTVTVRNQGPQAARGVTLEDILPANTDFQGATASQGNCSSATPGRLTCDLGTLQSGERARVVVRVTPRRRGTIRNRVRVESDTFDGSAADNADSESTSVTGSPGLTG